MGVTRPGPPSGTEAPVEAQLPGGPTLDLVALAAEACERYRREYPDEQERYGEAGHLWCVHDVRLVLNWGALDLAGMTHLDGQLAWLARVLHGRDFPLDRLVRGIGLAADVTAETPGAADLAERLRRGARSIQIPPPEN
jgi:hypothetical protein